MLIFIHMSFEDYNNPIPKNEAYESSQKVENSEQVFDTPQSIEDLEAAKTAQAKSDEEAITRAREALGMSPSRRGFLRGTLATIALGFGNKSESKERNANEEYRSGIKEMFQRVERDSKESGMIYIEDEKGPRWEKLKLKKTNSASAIIDDESIRDMLSKNPKRLEIHHTHPEAINKSLEGRTHNQFTEMYPSISDLIAARAYQQMKEDMVTKTDLKFGVEEKYGAWSYSIQDPKWIDMMREKGEIENQWVTDLEANAKENHNKELLSQIETLRKQDPRLPALLIKPSIENLKNTPRDELDKFPQSLQHQIKRLREIDGAMGDSKDIKSLEDFDNLTRLPNSEKERLEYQQRYIDSCKRLGVKMEFRPKSEFK